MIDMFPSINLYYIGVNQIKRGVYEDIALKLANMV